MSVQKVLGFNPLVGGINNYQQSKTLDKNFVKNTFNLAHTNLNRPAAIVHNSPLGDPDKAVYLDLLA